MKSLRCRRRLSTVSSGHSIWACAKRPETMLAGAVIERGGGDGAIDHRIPKVGRTPDAAVSWEKVAQWM